MILEAEERWLELAVPEEKPGLPPAFRPAPATLAHGPRQVRAGCVDAG